MTDKHVHYLIAWQGRAECDSCDYRPDVDVLLAALYLAEEIKDATLPTQKAQDLLTRYKEVTQHA